MEEEFFETAVRAEPAEIDLTDIASWYMDEGIEEWSTCVLLAQRLQRAIPVRHIRSMADT
jgi:hypothetical protein